MKNLNDSTHSWVFGFLWLGLFVLPPTSKWVLYGMCLGAFLGLNFFVSPFKNIQKALRWFWHWISGAVFIVGVETYLIAKYQLTEFKLVFLIMGTYLIFTPFLRNVIRELNGVNSTPI